MRTTSHLRPTRLRTALAATFAAAALAVTLSACSTSSTSGAAASTPAAPAATATQEMMAHHGTFAGLNGKNVAGGVKIEGSTVTIHDFSSDEGPDLHLYLTTGTTEEAVAAGVEIDAVAYDKSSQTFTLPSGTDVSSYTYVVVHCDKAKAVFGAAPIS